MPFEKNDRVRIISAPARQGSITGNTKVRSGRTRYEVDFSDRYDYVLESNLEKIEDRFRIEDLIEKKRFGDVIHLRSIITHTRLTGRLADVIYSMEASNTTFFAYQFKPVLSFLDSPSQGILIADEVGLGKTIEAGLIWSELRARDNANRLLVICPAFLREQWQEELEGRFGVKADLCKADDLLRLLERQSSGQIHDFAAICSYESIRPPKNWDDVKNQRTSAKLARYIDEYSSDNALFDCLIVDEAHKIRNQSTQSYRLVKLLKPVTDNYVFLSATPVQLDSQDLFTLLNILDEDNFRFENAFNQVLEANGPLLSLSGKVRKGEVKSVEFLEDIKVCLAHPLLTENRQLHYLLDRKPDDNELLDYDSRNEIATRIERINMLSRVVNRTRKRDVEEERTIRDIKSPVIQMTAHEENMYNTVTDIVREYCQKRDLSTGFIQTIPQRQLSSCMPAAYRAWKKSQDINETEFLHEAGVEEIGDTKRHVDSPLKKQIYHAIVNELNYEELKENDSKYNELLKILKGYWSDYPNKKVILFAFYTETLRYLQERLSEDGIASVLIMGGMKESKKELINRFKDGNARIMLSSEVAAEGVNLQFCSFLINYDMPWNPMRVEQRIGRIDRIGQKEDRIQILNFFYNETIDERIYNRLFQRLDKFREALGDHEGVLGEKIMDMTYYLLSHKLTPEQELDQIEQTHIAIANKIQQEKALEEQASSLTAHGEYIINQVNAAREMQRYINSENLYHYLKDYFNKKYSGCVFSLVSADPLTVEIELSSDARTDLRYYLEKTRQTGKTRLGVAVGGEPVKCVFTNKIDHSDRSYEIVNQYHPVVRYIQNEIKETEFYPVVATRINQLDAGDVSPGNYVIVVRKWSATGLKTKEKLVYRGFRYPDAARINEDDAERLITRSVSHGDDWPEAKGSMESNDADGYIR